MDDLALMQSQNTAIQGVKRVFANIALNQTDAVVIPAKPKTKFRVIAVFVQTGATGTTLVFNSKPGGAGLAISMTLQNASNGGAVLPYNPVGWLETAFGEGLSVTTGLLGSTTGMQIVYAEVRDFSA